jgi:hypothetical protein
MRSLVELTDIEAKFADSHAHFADIEAKAGRKEFQVSTPDQVAARMQAINLLAHKTKKHCSAELEGGSTK